jgi:hypothetical protein
MILPPHYIAIPKSGSGPGVLVLHSWWGLNSFFIDLCDRLAENGFVALAPDLFGGRVATTVLAAKALRAQASASRREPAYKMLTAAINFLSKHEAVTTKQVALLGSRWAATGRFGWPKGRSFRLRPRWSFTPHVTAITRTTVRGSFFTSLSTTSGSRQPASASSRRACNWRIGVPGTSTTRARIIGSSRVIGPRRFILRLRLRRGSARLRFCVRDREQSQHTWLSEQWRP